MKLQKNPNKKLEKKNSNKKWSQKILIISYYKKPQPKS